MGGVSWWADLVCRRTMWSQAFSTIWSNLWTSSGAGAMQISITFFLRKDPMHPPWSLHSPKKLSENKWFLLLFPSGVWCLEATDTSSSLGKFQNRRRKFRLTLPTVLAEFSRCQILLAVVSFHGLLSPEKKTAKSEGDHSGKSSFTWISSGNCPMGTIVM